MRARRTGFPGRPTDPRRGRAVPGATLIARGSCVAVRQSNHSRSERLKPKWFLSQVATLLPTDLFKSFALCSKGEMKCVLQTIYKGAHDIHLSGPGDAATLVWVKERPTIIPRAASDANRINEYRG